MYKVVTLILLLSPHVLSSPQYSEDAYQRQYQEPAQVEDDGQYRPRIPQTPARTARPFSRINKVAQPLIPTAAPQPERYTRPQPQLAPVPQIPQLPKLASEPQEENYNSQPQFPIPSQDQRYQPQPQYPTAPTQEENYNRPQPQYPTEEKYIITQPQLPTAAPQEEKRTSKPLFHVQSLYSSQEDKYNRPSSDHYSTPIPIIKFDKSQSLDGSYKTSYETGNNIFAEETGFIKNLGVKDQEALVQKGSYSYTAPDGTVITTSYTADETGFRVEGSHIPTPPPIPEEIRKSLETIYEGIKQQQEAETRDSKYGKTRPGSVEETNSISDNYPNYAQYSQ